MQLAPDPQAPKDGSFLVFVGSIGLHCRVQAFQPANGLPVASFVTLKQARYWLPGPGQSVAVSHAGRQTLPTHPSPRPQSVFVLHGLQVGVEPGVLQTVVGVEPEVE